MKANLSIAVTLALLTLCLASAMRTKQVSGSVEPESEYLSPSEMALSLDGRSLFIVCERSNELLIFRHGHQQGHSACSGWALPAQSCFVS